MQVPGRIAPGLTFGAALSNSTRDLPFASLPVTTRRIGFVLSAMFIAHQENGQDSQALARCPHPTFPRERGKGIYRISAKAKPRFETGSDLVNPVNPVYFI
jgi:hypothetical protein